eukprot:3693759-Pleurochrysis_carterae.AAC.1
MREPAPSCADLRAAEPLREGTCRPAMPVRRCAESYTLNRGSGRGPHRGPRVVRRLRSSGPSLRSARGAAAAASVAAATVAPAPIAVALNRSSPYRLGDCSTHHVACVE